METFFPPYLNKGSSGRAVMLLQLLLLAGGHNRNITPDGQYGDQTEAGVKDLQSKLGFSGSDVDGNCGPQTREAWKAQTGLDINGILRGAFANDTVAVTPKQQ